MRREGGGITRTLMLLAVALVATGVPVLSQPSGRPLVVYTRPIVYNNPDLDSTAMVEFPFALDRSQLEFYRPDSTDPDYYARVFAQVILIDNQGRSADSNSTYFSARVADLKEATVNSQMLFNKLLVSAAPGSYSAKFSVIDAVSKRSAEAVIPGIEVIAAGKTKLTLAGATMAYRLEYLRKEQSGANSRMIKNDYLVLNAPTGIFARNDSVAYLYAELYNLKDGADSAGYYRVAYSASDLGTGAYRDLGKRRRLKGGHSAVLTDAFDIRGWLLGKYALKAVVTDLTDHAMDSALVNLVIIDPLATPPGAELSPLFDPYDSLTVSEKVHLVKYLLGPNEKATLARLNDAGKMTFLAQFWKEREANFAMSDTASRSEMVRRYRYANQNFSTDSSKTDGWSTDQGRIYMSYGKWDRRTDVVAPRVGNPFVIWYYYGIKEGKLFVFEDIQGVREYTLVHSNVAGEKYSDEWAERLKDEMLDLK